MNILITGASSGIGKALAFEYASKQSTKTLLLTARRLESLNEIKKELTSFSKGRVNVIVERLDVTKYDDVFTVFNSLAGTLGSPIDTVIVNAGVANFGRIGTKEHFEKERRTIETNLIGAFAVINASVAHFRENKGKVGKNGFTIVGMSSFSQVRGMPNLAAYSCGKAALKNYLEALTIETWNENINVVCIAPGYIESEMTEKVTKKPFVISAEDGARKMVAMIEAKKNGVVPFFPWYFLTVLFQIMPVWMYQLWHKHS